MVAGADYLAGDALAKMIKKVWNNNRSVRLAGADLLLEKSTCLIPDSWIKEWLFFNMSMTPFYTSTHVPHA